VASTGRDRLDIYNRNDSDAAPAGATGGRRAQRRWAEAERRSALRRRYLHAGAGRGAQQKPVAPGLSPANVGSHGQCFPVRGLFWRWSGYHHFASDKATVAACPLRIDYVRLPLGYRA